jgi:hypothetical protein
MLGLEDWENGRNLIIKSPQFIVSEANYVQLRAYFFPYHENKPTDYID